MTKLLIAIFVLMTVFMFGEKDNFQEVRKWWDGEDEE